MVLYLELYKGDHNPSKLVLDLGMYDILNPITQIGKENSYKVTLETPNEVGIKASASSTFTEKIKNWGFE